MSVPLFHVTGCNSQLLLQVGLHGTTVVLPAFDVRTFLRTAAERAHRPAHERARDLRARAGPARTSPRTTSRPCSRIAYGGAPIAPALVRRIQEAFPNARVGNGFGLTETSSIATFLPHEWAAEHADSVGFAAPVVDLALDEPVDGVGELLVRGPNVVGGYWNKPDATAATFVDGWLHTGDLARVDDGLVRVVDRAKDMINRGGENVYCVEVENALAGAPGVAEAAVVGVPDDVMGEKVGAVIVPLPGAAVRGRGDAGLPGASASRTSRCRSTSRCGSEPLPRNPGGKILKRHPAGRHRVGVAAALSCPHRERLSTDSPIAPAPRRGRTTLRA